MRHLKRVYLFLSMNKRSRLVLLEAWVYLAFARIYKSRSFSKVVHSLGIENGETSYDTPFTKDEIKTLKEISQAIHIMSRYTFWESMCLVKAVACMKMLNRRHFHSTLYLGTAKDEAGKLIAHAWLRCGSFYLTGFEEKDCFTIVSRFAKYSKEIDGEKEIRKNG